ncbi:MAG: hypothetical protein EPO24_06505, partial [Bacteroidetes bacterium]
MKLLLSSIVLFSLLLCSFTFAQQHSDIFSITPQQPKIGDNITITYNAFASGALLKEVKEITALCLVYRGDEDPLVMETSMKQEGTLWKAEFLLAEENAKHIAFQLFSGDTYDDNSRDCWNLLVYGNDGKPVKGAHYSYAQVLQNGGQHFGESKNPDKAKEELTKELELYSENPDAQMFYVRLHADEEKTPETTEKLLGILNSLSETLKENEEKLYGLSFLYSMIGHGEKGKEIENTIVEKNPKGYVALRRALRPYYSEQNTDKAAELFASMVESFPDMDEKTKQSIADNLVYRYTNEKQFDKAEQWLLKAPKPSNVYYNYLAKTMVENDANLEKAAALAQKAVQLNKDIQVSSKPSSMWMSEWEATNKSRLGASLGTHGYALLKLNRFSEAEPVLQEAYTMNDGSSPDINQRYVLAMVNNKNYDNAINTGLECIKNLHDNAKLLEDLKE